MKITSKWYMVIIFSVALVLAILIASCGDNNPVIGAGPQGPQGPAGPQGANAPALPCVVSPTITVPQFVAAENAYRESVGQGDLIKGLVCQLFTVPTNTTSIATAVLTGVTTFEYNGVFNQPNASVTTGFNVLPLGLQTYQTWFITKCYGNLVVQDNNYHAFDLSSDDGSILYIDGLLINNDGLHGVQTVSGSRYLKYGFHSFELDFFQGGGNQALILNEDGAVMGNSGFYH